MKNKYRLVTRSDFDGLVCAVLFNELNLIDEVVFAHPKDMQDGKVPITKRDIITNLPFVSGAYMVFDHHDSEITRNSSDLPNHIIVIDAPSASRVVYNHYGGKAAFPNITEEMMNAVDQADAAQYSKEDILNPQNWTLLNYIMDSRTGLGRFHDFRISNQELMMDLIEYCRSLNIDQLLALPDVVERLKLYHQSTARAKEQILHCSKQYNNLVVLDLRQEETIWAVNRFMIYALFPSTNISIHVNNGVQKKYIVFATGKSIIDRGSKTHVGNLMLQFGGGGHRAAGTCQVSNEKAEAVLKNLIEQINADG